MKGSTLLIVGCVLAFLLLSPSLIAGAGDLFKNITRWIETGQWTSGTQLPIGAENQTSGTSGLTLAIQYKDGTIRRFTPDKNMLIPLTITDTGGEVKSIEVIAVVYASHTLGDSNTWKVSITDFDASLCFQGQQASPLNYLVKDKTTSKSGENWLNVAGSTEVSLETWSASRIEESIVNSGNSDGDYSLYFNVEVQLEITSTLGIGSASASAKTLASWDFNYSKPVQNPAQIVAISVSIGTYPLR